MEMVFYFFKITLMFWDVPVDLIFRADDEELNKRCAFYKDTDGALRHVDAIRDHYDPFVYTLLFPFGGKGLLGYSPEIPCMGKESKGILQFKTNFFCMRLLD